MSSSKPSAEVRLRHAQNFGRRCPCCYRLRKDWSTVGQLRCDACIAKREVKKK